MKQGTIELIILCFAFLALQFWWIRMTIKKGRTGEVDKWGRRSISNKDNDIEITKKKLEKLFKS